MRRTRRWLLAAAVGWSICASASEEKLTLEEKPARLSSRDVKIPKALTKKIEEDYQKFLVQQQVLTKLPIRRQLFNVSVEMVQKRPGPLVENVRVTAPLGGGVVDLSEFVTPLKGSFQVKILATKEDGSAPTEMQVYFVSKAKQRKIDKETFGSGCNKFMDITAYFASKMSAAGFEVYTAEQRYLSVLGGTFVLVGFEKDDLFVGSLTITDSRYAKLLCD